MFETLLADVEAVQRMRLSVLLRRFQKLALAHPEAPVGLLEGRIVVTVVRVAQRHAVRVVQHLTAG